MSTTTTRADREAAARAYCGGGAPRIWAIAHWIESGDPSKIIGAWPPHYVADAIATARAEGWQAGREAAERAAAESGARRRHMLVHGVETRRTCSPIVRWSTADVWAYLYQRGLPVHPAYAMSYGGHLDRDWLRVSPLAGERAAECYEDGSGFGRLEWERRYYGWRLAEIERERAAQR